MFGYDALMELHGIAPYMENRARSVETGMGKRRHRGPMGPTPEQQAQQAAQVQTLLAQVDKQLDRINQTIDQLSAQGADTTELDSIMVDAQSAADQARTSGDPTNPNVPDLRAQITKISSLASRAASTAKRVLAAAAREAAAVARAAAADQAAAARQAAADASAAAAEQARQAAATQAEQIRAQAQVAAAQAAAQAAAAAAAPPPQFQPQYQQPQYQYPQQPYPYPQQPYPDQSQGLAPGAVPGGAALPITDEPEVTSTDQNVLLGRYGRRRRRLPPPPPPEGDMDDADEAMLGMLGAGTGTTPAAKDANKPYDWEGSYQRHLAREKRHPEGGGGGAGILDKIRGLFSKATGGDQEAAAPEAAAPSGGGGGGSALGWVAGALALAGGVALAVRATRPAPRLPARRR